MLTDGRGLPKDPNPTWQGYSVGHWDGDTLVVESAGFNDKTLLDIGGHPHTEDLRVTERFHRIDFGHMQLKTTFDDPKAYTRAWTVSIEIELVPDTELLEYVYNENKRDLQHVVTTNEDRKGFQTEVKVSPEVLTQYAGTYDARSWPHAHIRGHYFRRSTHDPAARRGWQDSCSRRVGHYFRARDRRGLRRVPP